VPEAFSSTANSSPLTAPSPLISSLESEVEYRELPLSDEDILVIQTPENIGQNALIRSTQYKSGGTTPGYGILGIRSKANIYLR
jgi:hypothetical protein